MCVRHVHLTCPAIAKNSLSRALGSLLFFFNFLFPTLSPFHFVAADRGARSSKQCRAGSHGAITQPAGMWASDLGCREWCVDRTLLRAFVILMAGVERGRAATSCHSLTHNTVQHGGRGNKGRSLSVQDLICLADPAGRLENGRFANENKNPSTDPVFKITFERKILHTY